MKKINKNFITYLFIGALTLLVFWNFFFRGLFPYPGNYMLAWYEPWKSDHLSGQTITISHKAVADDTFRQLFPFRLLASEEIKNFELPLWNPYNGSGMPLMATMHSGFLNPFNIFFVIFSAPMAWSIHIITQFISLCFFTYLYCRKIGLKQEASFFTTAVFSLSGFVITRLIFGEYIYVLSGLPLLLFLIETYAANNKSKKIFLTPFVVLFLFLSGQPQMILYVLITTAFYATYRIIKIKDLLFFFLQIIFGLGFASIQLFPTFELFQNAAINTGSSSFIFERFLLPFNHLITIIIPNYFGNQGTYNYWGKGDYIETIAATGSIPIFFAIFSLWDKHKDKRPIKNFYITAIILTIISTINWSATQFFFSLPIPILSTGIPSRIFVITSFAISVLAGIGFQKLIDEKISIRSLIYKSLPFASIMGIVFLITTLLYLTNTPCPNESSNIDCRNVAFRNTLIEEIIFIIFIFVLFVSFIWKKSFTRVAQIITILMVVSIGIYNSQKFLPFSEKNSFIPKNELITYLQANTLDGRVLGFGEANIKTDFATLFRFYDPNYYDPLYNKRYGELVAYPKNKTLLRSDVEIDQERNERLLDLLSVKYLIYKNSDLSLNKKQNIIWQNNLWTIIENKTALPRVFLVSNYEIESDNKKILNKLFSETFDPRKSVIIEKSISLNQQQKTNLKGNVLVKSYKENKIILNSLSNEDAILVSTDNYYPGWTALIDGKTTKVFRANYTFRGIILPKGKHEIVFIYQPDSVKFGILVSTLTGVLFLALVCKSIFYKRP